MAVSSVGAGASGAPLVPSFGNSSAGAALANQAELDMFSADTRTPAQQCYDGLRYAHAIVSDPHTTPTEKCVTQATLDAYARIQKTTDNATTCVAALRACFDAISNSTLGPVAQAVAMVGYHAMNPGNINLNSYDQCELGLSYTQTLSQDARVCTDARAQALHTLNSYDAIASQPDSLPQGLTILNDYLTRQSMTWE